MIVGNSEILFSRKSNIFNRFNRLEKTICIFSQKYCLYSYLFYYRISGEIVLILLYRSQRVSRDSIWKTTAGISSLILLCRRSKVSNFLRADKVSGKLAKLFSLRPKMRKLTKWPTSGGKVVNLF
jgi:hypothetical protein